jgi:RHS repeat-associated protein
VTLTFGYDQLGVRTSLTDSLSSQGLTTFSYDGANRVTSEQDKEGTATFTYDNANELTAVGGSRTESYSYDLNGNRNSAGYTTGSGNELTASPGPSTTYSYDNEGNLTGQTNTSTHVSTVYSYDYRNRLTGVSGGGTLVATYVYDALDRRIGAQDSGAQTWTVYDGNGANDPPYADFNGAGSLTNRYLTGPGVVLGAVVDQVLARTSSGGTTAWYLPDNLGTVRDIADTSVTVIYHAVYDSFGNVSSETGSANGDRFKFAGMQYDSTIGQYYDHARWYAPSPGRFLRLDPRGFAAGDASLYRYVDNGPTDDVDLTGEAAFNLDDAEQRRRAAQAAVLEALAAEKRLHDLAATRERLEQQNLESLDYIRSIKFERVQLAGAAAGASGLLSRLGPWGMASAAAVAAAAKYRDMMLQESVARYQRLIADNEAKMAIIEQKIGIEAGQIAEAMKKLHSGEGTPPQPQPQPAPGPFPPTPSPQPPGPYPSPQSPGPRPSPQSGPAVTGPHS